MPYKEMTYKGMPYKRTSDIKNKNALWNDL